MSEYHVVLLAEQALSDLDARQVHSLHEDVDGEVHYHLLIPVENAAALVESGVGTLGTGEVLAAPALATSVEDLDRLQQDLVAHCRDELSDSVRRLQATGAAADGTPVPGDAVGAVAQTVADTEAREAIILTRPHVVAEFFHVDWASRARRKLGVPVLHLLERETFDAQAEGYGEEGVTGL